MVTSATPVESKVSAAATVSTKPLLQSPAKAGARLARRFERLLTFSELAADFFTVYFSVHAVFWIRGLLDVYPPPTTLEVLGISLGAAVLFVLMLDREGAYRPGNSMLRIRETEYLLRASGQCYVLMLGLALFTDRFSSPEFVSVATLTVLTAMLIQKHLVSLAVHALHARGVGVQKVVIVGAGHTGRRVLGALASSPKLGLDPVVIVDANPERVGASIFAPAYRRERSVPVKTGPVTKEFLEEYEAALVVIAVPSLERDQFVQIFNHAAAANARLAFVPNHYVPSDLWIEHLEVDGLLLASFGGPAERHVYTVIKGLFDFIVGSLLLLLAAPFCFLMGLLIRLDSPGPVLFVQERVGKDGKRFNMFKFRTMYVEAPAYCYSPRTADDGRITKIGRFLRRTSLDELPQLLNVVKGDMSLVGPRPEMPFIVEQYNERHCQRLRVKPGLTGLWQISADRKFLIHENIEYDLYYIRNRSFFMDLAILLHTLFFAMRGI